MRQINGIGVTSIFLVLALILASAFGFKLYKSHEKKAELARQEQIRREAEARKAEISKRLADQKDKVFLILRRWDDALKLASMTSRIALAHPVSQMQEVRRDIEGLKVDNCIERAAKVASDGMNDAIFAFEMFIRFPNNSVASESTSTRLQSSTEKIQAARQDIDDCISAAQ